MLVNEQMTLMLWRKTFLFTELNAFPVSSRRTASVCSSLNIFCIAWTAASHPYFCPAYTCDCPTDEMMSSRRVNTITFPTILLSTSRTPIDRNPGFLSNGIRQENRKASRVFARSFTVHSFMLPMAVHKSVGFSANYLDVRILF